jgi:hypothetical protein
MTMTARDRDPAAPPARAGVGLRAPHVAEAMAARHAVAWFEVHVENYMGGGPALARVETCWPAGRSLRRCRACE